MYTCVLNVGVNRSQEPSKTPLLHVLQTQCSMLRKEIVLENTVIITTSQYYA